MHESFHSLKPEKQNKIINAAMKVFAQNPYRKASTDDIAAFAGISKGSLFYHFKNKKDLYCFLYQFSCKTINRKILHGTSRKLYENLDLSKFRNKEDVARATQMILWIGEGFLKERMVQGNLNLEEIQAETCGFMEILKHGFYKEQK